MRFQGGEGQIACAAIAACFAAYGIDGMCILIIEMVDLIKEKKFLLKMHGRDL
jgi:hypothetical protein